MFDRLREIQPNFDQKIVPVGGDIQQDFLGLNDSDHNQLVNNVSVAIHSAATLSFVEPLRSTVRRNAEIATPVSYEHGIRPSAGNISLLGQNGAR